MRRKGMGVEAFIVNELQDDIQIESNTIRCRLVNDHLVGSRPELTVIEGGKKENYGEILIRLINTVDEIREFVHFSHSIYKDDWYWPGQDDEEEMAYFLPEKNVTIRYLDTQLFVAERNNQIVGRIAACINPAYNDLWNQKVGFIGFFECIDDQKVANKLFDSAIQWIKNKGMKEVYGPFNLTSNDVVGIMIKGFNRVPTCALPYNPEYYQKLFENYGFEKIRDTYELKTNIINFLTACDKKKKMIQHLLDNPDITVRPLNRDNFEEEVSKIRKVFNISFASHWGFCPVAEDEFLEMMKYYCYNYIPEDLFLIVEDKGKIVGFAFFNVDYNQKKHAKRHGYEGKITHVKEYIVGVLPEYQKKGFGKLLIISLGEQLKNHDFTEVSVSWIVEDNVKSLGLFRGLGFEDYSLFRVYRKQI
ncbi:hypothetical protein BBF96_09550 [Anoxybacter fermentans]|uniref:N-acetyltransferase domain-containing protein n=1 Tax=Anoxybacter fermentans TaxID=1323375 RepID=A0A3Q9HQP4_9FIRM|nr:GNAT family N-acetyltransferase [Anoxybacter fermentans]AZR73611.1 hypothetical protein BBF96_09550 [Anoxybacter fermentans]